MAEPDVLVFDQPYGALDAITREELVQAAQTVQLDTVYFLKGKEEEQ